MIDWGRAGLSGLAFLAGAVAVSVRRGDRVRDFPRVFMRHPAGFLVGALIFASVPVGIGAVAGEHDHSDLSLIVARVCGVAALFGQAATYVFASSKPADWQAPGWAYWGTPADRDSFRRRLAIGTIPISLLVVLVFLVGP